MEGKEVIILVLVRRLVLVARGVGPVVEDLVLAVLTISKRENVIPALDHEEREVEVGELEVDIPDLTHGLLGLCGNSLGLIIELLAGATLINGHFKFVASAACVGRVLLVRRINHNYKLLLWFTLTALISH